MTRCSIYQYHRDMYEIKTLGADVLREQASDVTEFGPELKRLTSEMFMVMKRGEGIGLAAPQVGVLKNVFVVQLADGIPRVFVNPEIIETSLEQSPYEEGCLSVPGIYADVIRPDRVRVQAYTEEGKRFTVDASGLLARVIQHEHDHLKGVLFVDRLPETKRERVLRMYKKRYRK